MDIQPLISSAVVAAVVSGIVSFLSTRATLKASRNKDRFDRLFPILRTIKTKLHEIQVKQIELGHVIRQSSRSITEQQKAVKTILEMQRLHDETVLLYVSEKAVFDKDLRNLLTTEYEELLSAARQRTLYPSSLAVC